MGMFRCERCEQFSDSKGGDCYEDPNDPCELVHWDCLTEEEQGEVEYMESVRREAMSDKINRTPEYKTLEKNK